MGEQSWEYTCDRCGWQTLRGRRAPDQCRGCGTLTGTWSRRILLSEDYDVNLTCPICRYTFDATANMTGKGRPGDGDANLCIECAGITAYDSSVPGGLRFCTDEELKEFMADPRIQQMRWALQEVKRRLGPTSRGM